MTQQHTENSSQTTDNDIADTSATEHLSPGQRDVAEMRVRSGHAMAELLVKEELADKLSGSHLYLFAVSHGVSDYKAFLHLFSDKAFPNERAVYDASAKFKEYMVSAAGGGKAFSAEIDRLAASVTTQITHEVKTKVAGKEISELVKLSIEGMTEILRVAPKGEALLQLAIDNPTFFREYARLCREGVVTFASPTVVHERSLKSAEIARERAKRDGSSAEMDAFAGGV